MLSASFVQSVRKMKTEEIGFKLPLSALVKGKNSWGRYFTESTMISYISQHGVSFKLKAPVYPGHKLKLIIELPPRLGENLKLFIQGKVVFVEATRIQKPLQKVSLRFGSTYRIQAEK
ncbi:MAG: hypothetical protein GTO17_12505 [Candidatus Aminicenantes bacterium]|nr:hypothetical protein [Candidatus Aminicenantes bacterium]